MAERNIKLTKVPVLASFRRWKVCILKEFVLNVARQLVGNARTSLLPSRMQPQLLNCRVFYRGMTSAEYQQLLTVGEAVMPDPLTELTVGWQSQEDGIKNKDLFIVPVVVNMGKCCALSRSRIRERVHKRINLAVIP